MFPEDIPKFVFFLGVFSLVLQINDFFPGDFSYVFFELDFRDNFETRFSCIGGEYIFGMF